MPKYKHNQYETQPSLFCLPTLTSKERISDENSPVVDSIPIRVRIDLKTPHEIISNVGSVARAA